MPRYTICLMAVVLVTAAARSYSHPQLSIEISENKQEYFITVPVSKIILSLPKRGDFSFKSSPTNTSTAVERIFKFKDQTTGVELSGYIGFSDNFASIKNPPIAKLGELDISSSNVTYGKLGDWNTATYLKLSNAAKAVILRADLRHRARLRVCRASGLRGTACGNPAGLQHSGH